VSLFEGCLAIILPHILPHILHGIRVDGKGQGHNYFFHNIL
jgi:hypothetical protein